MQTISLCMIVRDEEAVLGRCLDSVADCVDELIVVDTGSVDGTKEIAARYTNRVYDFVWIDDFAAARNESFQYATMDYCMWMDADDVLLQSDRQALLQLKAKLDGSADVVMLPYQALDEDGKVVLSYDRERLLRREAGFQWQGRVHEAIVPVGNLLYGAAAVTHCPVGKKDFDRNLRIYRAMLAQGIALGPREQYYYGRELYDHGLYREAEQIFSEFLERTDSWAIDQVEACRLLAGCYQQLKRPEKQLNALLRALVYTVPGAGLCCDLGDWFLEQAQYQQAIWWYEQALRVVPDSHSGAFIQQDTYGYIPCLQLCVCYDRLSQPDKAQQYNEQAAQYHPHSATVAYNRQYFQQQKTGRDGTSRQ